MRRRQPIKDVFDALGIGAAVAPELRFDPVDRRPVPIRALLPVPALAGTALLTFARIIRLGADMDDELKGTV